MALPSIGTNQRIVDRLLADAKLTRDQHAGVIEYVARHKARVEDAIIDLDLMSELELLKFIATIHSTRFVSTDKLSKAAIDPRVIARVSHKIATLHGVFPVLYDDRTGALTVVTPDPDNDVALHELKLAAGVKSVIALVARPAAVRAAIAVHYGTDKNAFVTLLRNFGLGDIIRDQDPYQRNRARASSHPPPRASGVDMAPHRRTIPMPTDLGAPSSPPPQPSQPSQAPPQPMGRPPQPSVLDPSFEPPRLQAATAPQPALATLPPAGPEFIETLNVLISLLENSRQDLRGHSAMVARLVKKTCERIGLSPQSTNAVVAAGYLHDLGKMGTYHLTPLNVSEYEGHRVAAQKAVELPIHLMESVGLHQETVQAVSCMYERWDGRGLPNGQAGKEIPLGARVLSVVDTYADLTQNPRNPYRKVLRPFEACEVLAQYRGQVFDPNVVDLFRQAMTGDDMRAKLLHDRYLVLVVDPDPEETTVLELRLIEQGFEVRITRALAQARAALEAGDVAAVVSEIDLDQPDAGLTFRQSSMNEGFGRDVCWVMLTSKADRQTAQRAFDLGVDDFVAKPASADIFAAKLRQLIERKQTRSGGRGVSGSLAEMSLPDMIQILWHGRKTCALRINAHNKGGEIEFAEGQVVNARWDTTRGEDAFYKMLMLREGDFRLDPAFKPQARTINASPEALLLEGMRRLDEGQLSANP